MKKKCKMCPNLIPDWKEYCSDECYYEAKKQRSKEQYRRNKIFRDRIEAAEKILDRLWSISVLKYEWAYNDLEKLQFDFTISTGQLAGKGGEFWTVVGEFAYYINPKSKNVSLWKKPSK